MEKYELSPDSNKSGAHLGNSELSLTAESQFYRENQISPYSTSGYATRPKRNLEVISEETSDMARTYERDGEMLNSDLEEDLKSNLQGEIEHNPVDYRRSTESVNFVLTETHFGGVRMDVGSETHQNVGYVHEEYNSQDSYHEKYGASIENSVENSDLMNMVAHRNLSPNSFEANNRGSPDINVGSFSESQQSNIELTESERTLPDGNGEHIRVENNMESEDPDEGNNEPTRYPVLQDVKSNND